MQINNKLTALFDILSQCLYPENIERNIGLYIDIIHFTCQKII